MAQIVRDRYCDTTLVLVGLLPVALLSRTFRSR